MYNLCKLRNIFIVNIYIFLIKKTRQLLLTNKDAKVVDSKNGGYLKVMISTKWWIVKVTGTYHVLT